MYWEGLPASWLIWESDWAKLQFPWHSFRQCCILGGYPLMTSCKEQRAPGTPDPTWAAPLASRPLCESRCSHECRSAASGRTLAPSLHLHNSQTRSDHLSALSQQRKSPRAWKCLLPRSLKPSHEKPFGRDVGSPTSAQPYCNRILSSGNRINVLLAFPKYSQSDVISLSVA